MKAMNDTKRANRVKTLKRANMALALMAVTVTTVTAAAPATAHPRQQSGGQRPPRLGACGAGQLCLWRHDGFTGGRTTHELAGTEIESCVPLPSGATAGSLANRTGRPVTTYQSAVCAETGEFDTHPSGSWTPESPYRVRAFKIWEN